MNLDNRAIEDLADIITGDTPDPDKSDYGPSKKLTKYKSGRDLVAFFNNYGYRDVYENGLPDGLSRKKYTILKLKELNNTKQMEKLLNDFVFSRNYINTDFDINRIVKHINTLIKYCGYELMEVNNEYIVTGDGLIKDEPVQIENTDFDINRIVKHINTLIKYCGYELMEVNNEYIVTGDGLIKDEPVQIETTFEDIQSKVITEIRNAKYTIWVAVAWFTDNILFKELMAKKQEGLNIQIIVLNDQINSVIQFEKYFETYRVSPFGMCENIFHQKFCIIDLQTVIHGSYNWTKKAQFNKEDITTLKNRELAEQYADRFKELKLLKN